MKKWFSLFAALWLVGCTSPTLLTSEEQAAVIAQAVDAALASGKVRPGEEAKLRADRPVLAYYFLARPLADYSVHWSLGDRGEIVVHGRGDLFKLGGAIVERKTRPPQ